MEHVWQIVMTVFRHGFYPYWIIFYPAYIFFTASNSSLIIDSIREGEVEVMEERFKDTTLLALKMEEETMSQGMQL